MFVTKPFVRPIHFHSILFFPTMAVMGLMIGLALNIPLNILSEERHLVRKWVNYPFQWHLWGLRQEERENNFKYP